MDSFEALSRRRESAKANLAELDRQLEEYSRGVQAITVANRRVEVRLGSGETYSWPISTFGVHIEYCSAPGLLNVISMPKFYDAPAP